MLRLAASSMAAMHLAGAETPGLPLCVFSKHLQFLKDEALAEAAIEIGAEGLDLTVRSEGHVLPERVSTDLPRLVNLLQKKGIKVPMVTTSIVDASSRYVEEVLSTCSRLGINTYRWAGFKYDANRPILQQLNELKPPVAGLAALNKKYKVRAIYHTHSGVGLVGASIWDLNYLLKDFDPASVAINYDVGHATVEGGYGGWINSFRVSESHLGGVALKDFAWVQEKAGTWRARWKPIGEGMVRFPQFFGMLKKTKFSGPVQVHFEYPLGGAESGKTEITIPAHQVLSAMKTDIRRIREMYAAAARTV